MNEADENPMQQEPMQQEPMREERDAAADGEAAAWLSYVAPVHRIPNAADAMVFLLLLGMGLVAMVGLIGLGLKPVPFTL